MGEGDFMSEEDKPKKDNVIELRILGKKKGSPGRAGRENPGLADRKTEDALNRIRKEASGIDRSRYAEPSEPIALEDQREEDFCIYATTGWSLAESWRKAFHQDGEPRAEYHAKNLAKVPRIMLRINELLDQRRADLVNEAERLRSFISSRLELEATTAREGSTRLKAIELLGKQPHVGAFEDRQRVLDEKSDSAAIREELTKRLAKLGGGVGE